MVSTKEQKEFVAEKLMKRFNKDYEFKATIQAVTTFYGKKIMAFASEPEDKKFVEDHTLEVVSEQFLLGYYIMSEMLEDPEFQLEEEAWNLGKGYIRNTMYSLLETVMQDSDVEWQQSDLEKQFTKRVLASFYDAYEVTVQLRKDVLALGAYYAFTESPRYQEPPEKPHSLRLATPYDLTFLNPQVYMQGEAVIENMEKWTLFQTESIKGAQKVGTIQLIEKARDTGEVEIHLEILISQLISQNEITDIINQMIEKIPQEEHARTVIDFFLVTDQKTYQL
ncbi:hypothetical protein [Planococcus alpniumensis]|uniref:hypothetical protein n=1 Tax=Planococcus alpniumensis TaxID=2708345 RepID=UPI001B8AD6B8|nr:hypothetical protein [Planococcus sp. MSAK28401]